MEDSRETSLYKRIVRTEFLYTVIGIFLGIIAYGYVFLDDHLEWGLEYVLGRSAGAEVNIGELNTGWLQPSLKFKNVQFTDPSKPSENLLELEQFSFRLNLDALLRLKFVVEEATLDGVRTATTRRTRGWVSSNGGDLRWSYGILKQLMKAQLRESTGESIPGDFESILSGESVGALLREEQSDLVARPDLNATRKQIQESRSQLDEEVKGLPDSTQLAAFRERLNSVENPLQKEPVRLKAGLKTLKELDSRVTQWEDTVDQTRRTVNEKLNELQKSVDSIDRSIETDQKQLDHRVALPELTLSNPSSKFFTAFVAERGGLVRDLLSYYQDYIGSGTKSSSANADSETNSGNTGGIYSYHPGFDYNYQAQWTYPDVWLKNVRISGSGEADEARYFLRFNDVSTYSPALRSSSGLAFKFNRPTEKLDRFQGSISKGTRGNLRFQFTLDGLDVEPWTLISSRKVTLKIKKGDLMLDLSGTLRNSTYTTLVNLRMKDPQFMVEGSSDLLREALLSSVTGLNHLKVQGTGKGTGDAMEWRIKSNLDDKLVAGLNQFIQDHSRRLKEKALKEYTESVRREAMELRTSVNQLRQNYLKLVEDRRQEVNQLKDKVDDLIHRYNSKVNRDSLGKSFD
ncbi:MAG: TIGR03545 family protein [bacterium]